MSSVWNGLTGQGGGTASAPYVQYGTSGNGVAQQAGQNKLGAGAQAQGAAQQGAMNTLGQGFGGQGNQAWGQYQQQGNAAQGAATNLLGQTAAGGGPAQAAAQAQLAAGTGADINAQMAMANSAKGGFGLANAQKQAQQAGAGAMATGANNAAQLQAQMSAQAQGQYAQSANAMAGNQLGAAQGMYGNQLNAMGQGQAAQIAGEQLQQGYEGQGLGAISASTNADLQNSATQAGIASTNANNSQVMAGGAVNAAGQYLSSMSDENAKTDITPADQPWSAKHPGSLGAGPAGMTAAQVSDARAKKDVADAAHARGYHAGIQAAQQYGGQGLPPPPTPTQNLEAGHDVDELALRRQAEQEGKDPEAYIPQQQPNGTYIMPPTQAPQQVASLGAQPGPRGAPLPSDERGKDVNGGEAPVDQYLGSLHPITFRYKDRANEPNPSGPGEQYLGVRAQDVERTPEGAKMVSPGPDGLKRINVASMTGANAAALGRLDERLRALESRRGAGVR